MSGSQTSLDAAATERKARLAKLASLKRKQPGAETTISAADTQSISEGQGQSKLEEEIGSKTDIYISGRNYDIVAKGPKLGFEQAPSSEQDTVEQQAEQITSAAAVQAAKDEEDADKAIDLFKLQPKKPNWDLKRELAERSKTLDVQTQNAIARLVRQRIENAKKEAQKERKAGGKEEGEELGVEGSTLVEAVHLREREEEEEERKEKELEEEDGIS